MTSPKAKTPNFDGWRQIVLDQIDSKLSGRTRRSVGLNFPVELHAVIMRAARERGLSMAAYVRRAALAFAVKDLGLDWDETMKDEPGLRKFGEITRDAGDKLAGSGYGRWKIAALEGEHVSTAGESGRTAGQGPGAPS